MVMTRWGWDDGKDKSGRVKQKTSVRSSTLGTSS